MCVHDINMKTRHSIWVPGMKLKSSDLAARALHPLSHFTGPQYLNSLLISHWAWSGKGTVQQMWLCGLFCFVVFVCLALWRSLKKLSSAPAPRSWQTVLSWVGEGPTAAGPLTSSLHLWKHLVTKDLLDPSLPSSNPICFSKSRSLSVCV